MDVKILYLSHQGRSDMEDVVSMLSKDVGPIKFQLIDRSNISAYFLLHRDLNKIGPEDFRKLSELIREEHSLEDNDIVVIVSPRKLTSPYELVDSFKNWVSFYDKNNIIVRSSGYNEITEGKPYLGVAHQIVENLFQNLGGIDLAQIGHTDRIHTEQEICVNDFCEEFNQVKGKMRSGFICRKCKKEALNSYLSRMDNGSLQQIENILTRISNRLKDNYNKRFTPEELRIEVKLDYNVRGNGGRPNCGISIGGQLVDFGNIKRSSHIITYLFYLINARLDIGKSDFEGKGYENTRENYERLHELLKGKLYEDKFKSYLNSMTSYHSRISTRLLNQMNIEDVGHMYRFQSRFIDQDVSVYSIHVEPENLILPEELLEFRVDRGQ